MFIAFGHVGITLGASVLATGLTTTIHESYVRHDAIDNLSLINRDRLERISSQYQTGLNHLEHLWISDC